MAASNEKDKALSSAISILEKKYGSGAIMQLGSSVHDKVEAYSTGSLGLDIALGIGGMPKGRICEIYGPESSGKTTLALHLAAEVQKVGGTVVFIDAEHALDINYARKLGVDTSKLLVSQPDCGEQALEICETLINSGSVDLIIVDSVAALVPRAEIDGEMGDQQPGLQARLMSKALRKLTAIAARFGTSILFINQIRMKIGVMFGSPETTTGGNALKFYSSVRLDVRRISSIKDANDVTGNRVKVKVVKNKVAPPFKSAEFDINFNEGICKVGELVDLGVEQGIIDKAGAWYSYKGERLGQGREGAKQFLKENPEILSEIDGTIRDSFGIPRQVILSTVEKTELNVDKSSSEKTVKGSKKKAPIGEKADIELGSTDTDAELIN
ncbi:MAG: recombinase RecA [SAR324 cluster bacterium]|uniref:Protein RecA n=1 Tax=SAR324 cluster bacterium TaxID=2024889 RepID=A0A7X9ILJ3_9DELT|nr:recombinase RecA [SAR324 cluster bacterium]